MTTVYFQTDDESAAGEVRLLISEGSTNTEIARRMKVTRPTVKWHLHNVYEKTGAHNREALLRLALQLKGAGQ